MSAGDDRYQALAHGLRQVPRDALLRLHEHLATGNLVVLDNCHFDERRGLWCPLAVALDVHARIPVAQRTTLTNRAAEDAILAIGREENPEFSLNPVHRFRGYFYRRQRHRDLRTLVGQLVEEKQ